MLFGSVTVASLAIILPGFASAQSALPAGGAPPPSAAPPASAGAAATGALEEIVVTAQRRTERLQDTALSATALVGTKLADAGKTTVDSALSQVPAVRVEGSSNGGQIFIRGVGSDADSQLGDPAVNLNIDGIYQQETEAVTSAIYDVNRIEVLRGPQGTLYGRNSTAGAVNIITNDPVLHQNSGVASAQYGNYSAVETDGAATAALGDTAAVRGAFTYQHHDPYLSDGNDDANTLAGRIKLLWQPTPRLRTLVAADYLHINDHDFGTVEAPTTGGEPTYDSNKPQGYRGLYNWSAHGQADYSLDWATLTLLVGHNDFHKKESNVLLGLAPSVADLRTGSQTTVEARIASAPSSPIKWVGGFYYYYDDEFRKAIASLIDVPAQPGDDPELQTATTTSYAGFGDVTVPITQNIRLTGGLRYTHDTKSAQYVYTDDSGTPSVTAQDSWNSLTYKGQAEMNLTRNSLVYAGVSSGFKAGGFSQQFPAASYNPEKLTAYEIGSKNEFLHHRLRLNLSGYYYNYDNYQVSYPEIIGGVFSLVTANAATATLYGAELEANYVLTPNDTLTVSGSYNYSRFGHFVYFSNLSGEVDHSNQQLPNAPLYSGDLSYDHRFDLPNGASLTGDVTSHITEGYWTSVERTTGSYQPAFTRTDAYLLYAPAGARWNVRVFVKNAEGTAVRTLGLQNPFDAVLLLAPPRTYGGGVTVKF